MVDDGTDAVRNVLVTCGGKWVGMVLRLRRAMEAVPPLTGGELIVADRAPLTPAGYFADHTEVVPAIDDAVYVEAVLDVCARRSVRVLVPIIDVDLARLAPHAARFDAIGTSLVAPSPSLVDLCFDKDAFHRFSTSKELDLPRRYDPNELADARYPLFYKRVRGFGSVGSGVCETGGDARRALAAFPDLIFQEFVDAPEVSVDAFVSREGRCTVRVQRVRDKVVGGESWQSHTINDPRVRDLANRTLAALSGDGLVGPLNIQVFQTDPPKLVEVNPRLGSASVFSDFACGGRLFSSVLRGACGLAVKGDPDDYSVGVHLYRYLGDVYHDGSRVLGESPPRLQE
jgi:carbamoyl-phosphate synthase large subunit